MPATQHRPSLRSLMGTRADWRLVRPARPRPPRPGPHWVGPAVVVATVFCSWPAFAGTAGKRGDVSFGLYIGSVSIVAMAWTFVLAVRLRPLERWFGGLDRVYRVHRWLGALAVVAMFLHTQTVDDPAGGIAGAGRDVADAAEELAELAELMLYALVGISLVRLIPTRYWRWTHKFLGVPYAFACFHFFTAEKSFAMSSPWGWWFTGWMAVGGLAWVVRVFGRDMVRPGLRYRVAAVDRHPAAIEVTLEPLGRALQHRAGQFVFIKVRERGLAEPHPFTIASAPHESNLRFFIRDLGDWTRRLGERLQEGAEVRVEGPYGLFEPEHRGGHSVWVAGGVGITPFLAAAVDEHRVGSSPPHLVYSVRSSDDAVALDQLEAADRAGRIVLHLHETSKAGRLDAARLIGLVGEAQWRDAHVAVCGPAALVALVRAAARDAGAARVESEDFDIRSGVGPDRSREVEQLVTAVRRR